MGEIPRKRDDGRVKKMDDKWGRAKGDERKFGNVYEWDIQEAEGVVKAFFSFLFFS